MQCPHTNFAHELLDGPNGISYLAYVCLQCGTEFPSPPSTGGDEPGEPEEGKDEN